MSRSLLAAVVAACAAIMPAAAWAQDGPTPTVTFDRPCYSPGDRMTFSGTGFTPGGEVELLFSSLTTQRMLGRYGTTADEAGAIGDWISTPDPDELLRASAFSGMIGVAANDRIRIEAGAGPADQQFAGAAFRLSRWEVELWRPNGGRVRAAKPVRITAVGFTHARGETLYMHYRRGGRTVRTIRLGRLTGECGDRRRTLGRALPRGLPPGRYELSFNTSARDARGDAAVSGDGAAALRRYRPQWRFARYSAASARTIRSSSVSLRSSIARPTL